MIFHHPSIETLIAFGAGNLPEAHARVVQAHTARCGDCAAALREADEVGGVLLEDLPPAQLNPDFFARVLSRIDSGDEIVDPASPPLTIASVATGRWRWAGPGIRMMTLIPRDLGSDTRLDLFRVVPGVGLLVHGHAGRETTCVLQGAFSDGMGIYRAGDIAECDGEHTHRPVALAGEECICLVATTGRLRARSFMGSLVGPLLGM